MRRLGMTAVLFGAVAVTVHLFTHSPLGAASSLADCEACASITSCSAPTPVALSLPVSRPVPVVDLVLPQVAACRMVPADSRAPPAAARS